MKDRMLMVHPSSVSSVRHTSTRVDLIEAIDRAVCCSSSGGWAPIVLVNDDKECKMDIWSWATGFSAAFEL